MTVVKAPNSEALSANAITAVSHCIGTMRAVRRFQQADIDPELIDFVLRHAIQAGSAKNRQPWRFVVVRDPQQRIRLGHWYRKGYQDILAWSRTEEIRNDAAPDEKQQMTAAGQLAAHFDEVPAVIVVCYLPTRRNPADFFGGASIYPAVQNLLLAARAVGLGATLTTLQALGGITAEGDAAGPVSIYDDLRHILGIPSGIVPAALIPVGWPAGRFSAGRRKPVPEVAYRERWGQAWGND
ncbi:nitroreductase family protein [Lentzea sp. NPDC051213]|uniref:nitroreductase family protein n=1 Tax=Lentzea sp. NPDC051213 TaxID=3364126 RepID=UPI00378727EB